MTGQQIKLLVAATALVLVVAPMVLLGWGDISPETLAARCEASTPRWNSYQEDIKGQIGARPVAEWAGSPVAARLEDGVVTVRFELEEPWRSRPASLPVILRLPDGSVHLPRDAGDEDGARRYRYVLDAGLSPPWVEIQYPHRQERLIFDTAGRWQR